MQHAHTAIAHVYKHQHVYACDSSMYKVYSVSCSCMRFLYRTASILYT